MLTKIIEKEAKFTIEFNKEKLKECFDLTVEVSCLHNIETNHLLVFEIELIKEIKLCKQDFL